MGKLDVATMLYASKSCIDKVQGFPLKISMYFQFERGICTSDYSIDDYTDRQEFSHTL